MPNIDKIVQVSDTTKANSSNADCCKKIKTNNEKLYSASLTTFAALWARRN